MIIGINTHFRISSDRHSWSIQKASESRWNGVAHFTVIPQLINAITREGDKAILPTPLPVPSMLARMAQLFASIKESTEHAPSIEAMPGFTLAVGRQGWNIRADKYQFIVHDGARPFSYNRDLGKALFQLASLRIRLIDSEDEKHIIDTVAQIDREIVHAVNQASLLVEVSHD